MIEGLKPYAKRKPSGALWLPEIPASWEMRRNGRLFIERNETNAAELPILEVSLRTGVRVRNFETGARKQVMADREKYKRARKGDLAYNMMRMWQGAVGVVPTDGLVSPAYVVARPLQDVLPAYFEYVFRTDGYKRQVNDYSRGIVADRNRLYWDSFKQIPTPFPPPGEQAAIVKFLGHADQKINRYIRAKRKLIALLNEQKQAIIHRAVTRGLDPSVKLRPSGVEWLGDVPQHWEIIRLGRVVELTTGFPFKSGGFVGPEDGIRLLRGINIGPQHIRWEVAVSWPSGEREHFKAYELRVGDIVLGMDRPIIKAGTRVATIANGDVPSLLLQRVARMRPTKDLEAAFLLLLLDGKGFADYLAPIFTGISVPHLSPEQIQDFRIPLPGLEYASGLGGLDATLVTAI